MISLVTARNLLPFGILLFGIFLGAGTSSLYYTAKLDRIAAVKAKDEAKIAEAARQAHEKAVERQNATETQYGKKLKHAQDETARIATLLASGNYRLRLAGMPEVATHSSPAATGAARPSEELRRAYSALRSDIDIVQNNLALCIATLENDRGL